MLGTLFGFSGRIGRLSYLLRTLALFAGTAVAGLVLGAATAAAGAEGIGTGIALAAVVAVPLLWGSCALMTRRVRDMGLPPLVVAVALLLVAVVDLAVIGEITRARFFPPFEQHTPVGGMVQLAFLAALLLWPGEAEPAGEGAPEAFRLAPAEPPREAGPGLASLAPALARTAPAQPRGFGRRGG